MKLDIRSAAYGDINQALGTIYDALDALRENLIPEGDADNDCQWGNIASAMAWICEALGVDPADIS